MTEEHVEGMEELTNAIKCLRDIYHSDDQQYIFAVKGTVGKLAKSKRHLLVTFADQVVKVPLEKITEVQELKDGWIGD